MTSPPPSPPLTSHNPNVAFPSPFPPHCLRTTIAAPQPPISSSSPSLDLALPPPLSLLLAVAPSPFSPPRCHLLPFPSSSSLPNPSLALDVTVALTSPRLRISHNTRATPRPYVLASTLTSQLVGEKVHDNEVPELGEAHQNLSIEVVDGQMVPLRSITVQNMDMPLERGRLVEERVVSSSKNVPRRLEFTAIRTDSISSTFGFSLLPKFIRNRTPYTVFISIPLILVRLQSWKFLTTQNPPFHMCYLEFSKPGMVNGGTATVIGVFAGMLYGGSKEAAASVVSL
ncbi:hypothetical protein Fmac_026188 [Flemingia macrophylla]|uniref:Uncharacterized protein n=1 Tax=Flemingia macrophylla TaxID=520843 RepID=A0ABD1LE56_9FABA